MMDRTTDFEKLGKHLPYRVPEGYMPHLQQQIVAQATTKATRRPMLKRFVWGAAASVAVALFAGAMAFITKGQDERTTLQDDTNAVYTQLSAADQEIIDNSYDDDIFLTLTL